MEYINNLNINYNLIIAFLFGVLIMYIYNKYKLRKIEEEIKNLNKYINKEISLLPESELGKNTVLEKRIKELSLKICKKTQEEYHSTGSMLLVLGKIGRGKFNERVYSNTENAILQSLAVEINKTTASLENTMEEINMILERELNFNKEENELLDACNLVDKKECISLEEFLTTKIRYIIDASNEMLQIQNGILNSVVEGIDDINKTAKQMNEISDNIEKIDQYIDNIEKISLSTSILSLNASVEAASAGKYGNGFAVVATEVSLLSQKSKDIAKNMRAMTKKTLKQAEISKKVSIETKEKFSKIIEEIKKEGVLK